IHDHFAPLGQPQRGELHREPVAVAVHDHSGQIIRLAETDSIARVRAAEFQDVVPEMKRGGNTVSKKCSVEGNSLLPGIQPDVDLRLAVVKPAGDEVSGGGDEIDLVSIGGGFFDAVDGAGEHPRVAPEEWLRAPGLQDDL